jgi:hypothetical protein
MIDPLTGAVIVQGALGAIQTGVGLAKARAATRPEYILPTSIEEQMTDAERMSYYGLPEAQKQEFLDNIARSTSGAVRGASDRRGGLGAIATASQMEQDAYKGLLSADAAARMANFDRLQQMRSQYAAYEDKAFELNELQPYMQEIMGAQALTGAGMQNIGGALNTLALGSIYEVMGGQGVDKIGGGGDADTLTGLQSATGQDWQDMIQPQNQTPFGLQTGQGRASSITAQTLSSVREASNSSFRPDQNLLNVLSMLGTNLGR